MNSGPSARSNPWLANPLLVKMDLSYMKVLSIDEPAQTITLIFEYDLTWNDPRLRWNASDFHDIEGFFVIRDTVWRPDVLPYDIQSISDARDSDIQHVYVKSNGDMFYYTSSVLTVICPLDIQRFPFDHQTCEVNFVSYNFLKEELHLVSTVKPMFDNSTAGNGEWIVDEVYTGDTYILSEGSSKNYETVTYTIRLRRSSTFYIVMIVIPSFVLTILCVFGLFWTKFNKTDYLEKGSFASLCASQVDEGSLPRFQLALGFAAILAMCTVLEIAEETVPKTKQLPSLTLFIMVNLLLITAAISLVVMGSKSCDIASAVKLTELSRKYMPTFGMTLCARFRTICLIVFPILTFLNLLVLLLNM